jgi:hypothetical protein
MKLNLEVAHMCSIGTNGVGTFLIRRMDKIN